MSLLSYFPEQFDQLKEFFSSDLEAVRCVRIDPEMKPMLGKALTKMEDADDFPHAFLAYTESFHDPRTYFEGLFNLLKDQYQQHKADFESAKIGFDLAYDKTDPPTIPNNFLMHAEALAEAIADHAGSLVFVLDPEQIADAGLYQQSIAFLSEETRSDWLKFLIFDDRSRPLIDLPSVEGRRIGYQTFYLSPEEIERRLAQDLAAPEALQPVERRQYKGLLAGFAFARGEYEKAEELQRRWVAEAETEGQPSETATALYNLGNTLSAKGDYEAATDTFCRTCDICIDHDLNALAPLAYTNLGVNLHRQGLNRQAFESLKVARDMFKALKNRPGEAHVVDCLARMYADDGLYDKAEEAWQYALFLYDGITSDIFKDLREVSRAGIIEKLERLYTQMGRPDKITALQQGG